MKNRKYRYRVASVAFAGLMATVLFAAAACGATQIMGKYVFSVGSEKCSVGEAKMILLQYQKEYASVYGINLWTSYSDVESLEEYVRDLTVSQLAEVYTLYVIAGDRELTLSDEELEQTAAAAAEYIGALSEEERDYLGVSEREAEALYEKYLLAQKLYTGLTEGVSQEVSDDEARVMELKQICVSDSETAEQLLTRLDDGADFSSLAESCNENGTTDLQVSRTTYDDSVTEILFALNNGEYSEIIELDGCYYIFYCSNYFNEELTEQNKENVISRRMEEAVTDVYDSYTDSLDSSLNESVWSEVTVDTDLELSGFSFGEIYDSYFGDE